MLQDSDIPPSERCRYKTDKKPTGPFNRQQLLDFLETKAKDEKDWEDAKPYIKEIRGAQNCQSLTDSLISRKVLCCFETH